MKDLPSGIQIKVCGIKNYEQVLALSELPIHFIGHIFYPKSPRFLRENIYMSNNSYRPPFFGNKKKVGIFVNPNLDDLMRYCIDYALDVVQLHGSETEAFCRQVKKNTNCSLIKAFSIRNQLDIPLLERYVDEVSYFLFDTSTTQYGGSGKKFDWELLRMYHLPKPFFLSGGIRLCDVVKVKDISSIPGFFGVDINSGFEISPGYKDISKIYRFIREINAI